MSCWVIREYCGWRGHFSHPQTKHFVLSLKPSLFAMCHGPTMISTSSTVMAKMPWNAWKSSPAGEN